MTANKMDVTSWKNMTLTTPQQGDAQSCGVYVIKVGTQIQITAFMEGYYHY